MSKHMSIPGLLFLCACGPGSHPGFLAETRFPVESISDDLADQVIGHYAIFINYASHQEFPLVGSVNTLGQLAKIADIQRDGEGLRIIERNCRLKFRGGVKLGLTFSDASIRSSPVMEGRFMVKQDTPDGPIRFARESLTQVLGAQLNDPQLDPLPVSPDDPRVYDMDGDGKPGMTAKLRALVLSGSVNYVLRSTNHYEGTVNGEGLWQGLVTDKTEGVVLDVSNIFLRPTLGNFEFIPDPDPNRSTVFFLKIDEGMDCAMFDHAAFSP